MKTLTVIAPAYNEAEVIREFYTVLKSELAKLTEYSCDILIVVDGGTDGTANILESLAATDPRLRVLSFSRNFGHQMAFLAGIDHVDADVVVMMDCDLQHPPAVIRELLQRLEEGNDVVYTIRKTNEDTGMIRRAQSFLFYRFLNLISEIPIGENTSDFRAVSRRVITVIQKNIRERELFLRGIISWIGFKQVAVSYAAHERFAGTSKFSLRKLIKFGLSGIISFSRKPLRAATLTGLVFALFGFLYALYTVFEYFFGTKSPPGYATIVVLLSIFGGVQLFFLGVIGEYIGAIFDQVKSRPHYIIDRAMNIEIERIAR